MDLKLITVSKFVSEIINENTISFINDNKNNCNLIYQNLLLKIHEIYPTLYKEGDPHLYWQYSRNVFLKIQDYFTFLQMLIMMADKKVYMVLQDCDVNGEETQSYLSWLDYLREKKRGMEKLTKYDVFLHKCKKKKPPPFYYIPRTEEEILTFAVRNVPDAKCYTNDLLFQSRAAQFIRRGKPKRQKLKKTYVDVVLERAAPKAAKAGKKDQKKDKKKK